MAARENQGYLVAVIILVILLLCLGLSTFLADAGRRQSAESLKTTQDKLAANEAVLESYRAKSNVLEALVGDFGPSVAEVEAEIQTIKQTSAKPSLSADSKEIVNGILQKVEEINDVYKKDMSGSAEVAGGAPGEALTWRSRIQTLTTLVAKKNNDNKTTVERSKNDEKEAAQKIKAAQDLLALTRKTMEDLGTQLKDEKKRSLENETQLKGELAEAIKESENVNNEYKDFRAKSDSEVSSIKNELAGVKSENENMKIKINGYEREVFDRPDGQIVKVASRLKSVFINIGSEDGLPQNETFSIYDQDVINFDKGKHKAKIEVTRIYPYRAEARITEEDPTNPILSGDHVLTATWDPGNKVKFAVAGAFNLDGDIYDDRDKLIKMIERNGGEVVATHDSEGTITGKIDASVRYIVVGKPPTLAEDAGEGLMRNSSAIVAAMRTLEAEAKKNTVEPIDLTKLLNRMGVRAKPKTTIIQSGNIPLPSKSSLDSDR
ncbi:hypothetical protein N9B60_00245 [Mariniblastus sp.]|nr:hypothetical protein [Mariniblastus sp.]MDB4564494.1 hypothetical protein [Mariniblastus sp.]